MRKMWMQFRIWTAASVMSGYVALALTAWFDMPLVLIGLGTTVGGFAIERFIRGRRWYQWLWNGLAFCYLLFMVVDLTALSGLVLGITHLLIFVQIAKCANSKGHNDYVQIYLMSFFQLLASAALDNGLTFAAALLLFAVTTLRALVLFNMVCATNLLDAAGAMERADLHMPPRSRGWSWRLTTVTTVLAAGVLFGTVLIFCLIPRVEMGLLGRSPTDEATVGFDEEIDLSTYEELHDDDTVVMQVELPDYPDGYTDGPTLWKGVSLDIYNRSRWHHIRRRGLRPLMRGREVLADKTGLISPAEPSGTTLARQRIRLHNTQRSVLFGLPTVQRISGQFKSAIWDEMDQSWRLTTTLASVRQLTYTAYSDVSRPSARQLRAAPDSYSELIRSIYIENGRDWMRTDPIPAKVVTLALDVTADARTPFDKAMAISSYLRQNYTYLLDVERASDETPLEDFLFHSRAGHCQYFATAMAIMLRATGVPARIATGYRDGEWNEEGRFYLVLENHAHVWVEVYFPGYGWTEFDPSPASAVVYKPRLMTRILAATARYRLELQMHWVKYVIGYNMQSQRDIAREIGTDGWRSLVAAVTQRFRADEIQLRERWRYVSQSYVPAWVLGGVLLVLLVISFVSGHREAMRHAAVTPRAARQLAAERRRAVLLYGKMLRVLKYRRLVKPLSATPAEFSRAVAAQWPEGAPIVESLTEIYYTLRYARLTDSQPLITAAHRALNQLLRRAQPNVLTRRMRP